MGSPRLFIAGTAAPLAMVPLFLACAGGAGSVSDPVGGTSSGTTGVGGTSGGSTSGSGTSGAGTTSGGTSSGGSTSGAPPAPKRLLLSTTWQELDAEQTRLLTSETDDCFAAGFNLKTMLALLPRDKADTLRTDEVGSTGGWKLVGDESVHVTVSPGTDATKATCSAPVKGQCPTGGGDGPCRIATLPTIRFEGTTVTWSASNAAPTTFTSVLVVTPETLTVTSGNRMPAPEGWTSWVEYSVFLDADGFAGTVNDTGCSPCTNHVQRSAAFPPARSVSTRLSH